VFTQLSHRKTFCIDSVLKHCTWQLSALPNVGSYTYLLTHSMEQSPSWEADQSLQLVKKFPAFLWNLKAPYRTHKFLPPVPILSQLHPVPTPHPNSWRSMLILFYYLCLGLPNGLFPSGFTNQHPVHPKCATCSAHFILLDWTTHTTLGKEYRCPHKYEVKISGFTKSSIYMWH